MLHNIIYQKEKEIFKRDKYNHPIINYVLRNTLLHQRIFY